LNYILANLLFSKGFSDFTHLLYISLLLNIVKLLTDSVIFFKLKPIVSERYLSMSEKIISSETKNNRVFVSVTDAETGKTKEASQSYGVLRNESQAKTEATAKAIQKF
jgi:hypothetical protein